MSDFGGDSVRTYDNASSMVSLMASLMKTPLPPARPALFLSAEAGPYVFRGFALSLGVCMPHQCLLSMAERADVVQALECGGDRPLNAAVRAVLKSSPGAALAAHLAQIIEHNHAYLLAHEQLPFSAVAHYAQWIAAEVLVHWYFLRPRTAAGEERELAHSVQYALSEYVRRWPSKWWCATLEEADHRTALEATRSKEVQTDASQGEQQQELATAREELGAARRELVDAREALRKARDELRDVREQQQLEARRCAKAADAVRQQLSTELGRCRTASTRLQGELDTERRQLARARSDHAAAVAETQRHADREASDRALLDRLRAQVASLQQREAVAQGRRDQQASQQSARLRFMQQELELAQAAAAALKQPARSSATRSHAVLLHLASMQARADDAARLVDGMQWAVQGCGAPLGEQPAWLVVAKRLNAALQDDCAYARGWCAAAGDEDALVGLLRRRVDARARLLCWLRQGIIAHGPDSLGDARTASFLAGIEAHASALPGDGPLPLALLRADLRNVLAHVARTPSRLRGMLAPGSLQRRVTVHLAAIMSCWAAAHAGVTLACFSCDAPSGLAACKRLLDLHERRELGGDALLAAVEALRADLPSQLCGVVVQPLRATARLLHQLHAVLEAGLVEDCKTHDLRAAERGVLQSHMHELAPQFVDAAVDGMRPWRGKQDEQLMCEHVVTETQRVGAAQRALQKRQEALVQAAPSCLERAKDFIWRWLFALMGMEQQHSLESAPEVIDLSAPSEQAVCTLMFDNGVPRGCGRTDVFTCAVAIRDAKRLMSAFVQARGKEPMSRLKVDDSPLPQFHVELLAPVGVPSCDAN